MAVRRVMPPVRLVRERFEVMLVGELPAISS